jgi:hypothetical protein
VIVGLFPWKVWLRIVLPEMTAMTPSDLPLCTLILVLEIKQASFQCDSIFCYLFWRQFFTWAILEINIKTLKFGQLFWRNILHWFWEQIVVGLHFTRFFTNTSGHTALFLCFSTLLIQWMGQHT